MLRVMVSTNYFSVCYSNQLTDRECNEGDVRLVDSPTPDGGAVEVCLDGFWGSVCGDWWDYRDATVVCRQLGYDGCKS